MTSSFIVIGLVFIAAVIVCSTYGADERVHHRNNNNENGPVDDDENAWVPCVCFRTYHQQPTTNNGCWQFNEMFYRNDTTESTYATSIGHNACYPLPKSPEGRFVKILINNNLPVFCSSEGTLMVQDVSAVYDPQSEKQLECQVKDLTSKLSCRRSLSPLHVNCGLNYNEISSISTHRWDVLKHTAYYMDPFRWSCGLRSTDDDDECSAVKNTFGVLLRKMNDDWICLMRQTQLHAGQTKQDYRFNESEPIKRAYFRAVPSILVTRIKTDQCEYCTIDGRYINGERNIDALCDPRTGFRLYEAKDFVVYIKERFLQQDNKCIKKKDFHRHQPYQRTVDPLNQPIEGNFTKHLDNCIRPPPRFVDHNKYKCGQSCDAATGRLVQNAKNQWLCVSNQLTEKVNQIVEFGDDHLLSSVVSSIMHSSLDSRSDSSEKTAAAAPSYLFQRPEGRGQCCLYHNKTRQFLRLITCSNRANLFYKDMYREGTFRIVNQQTNDCYNQGDIQTVIDEIQDGVIQGHYKGESLCAAKRSYPALPYHPDGTYFNQEEEVWGRRCGSGGGSSIIVGNAMCFLVMVLYLVL